MTKRDRVISDTAGSLCSIATEEFDNLYPLAAHEYLDEAEGLVKQFEAEKGRTPDDWSEVRDAFPTSFRRRGKPSLHVV
jgi:hypothetical protein